jgi:hypothetical protein
MNNQDIIDKANKNDNEVMYVGGEPVIHFNPFEPIRSLADIKRIVELEAYLQKVQADRINDIAIERKRWAKADLVALEILRLEQQIKGVNDFANKFCGDCKTLEQAAVSYCAESFIKSLKEPKL